MCNTGSTEERMRGAARLDERDVAQDAGLGELPDGWRMVSMGDVASINMGQSPPSSTYNTQGEGLPFLQGKAEFGMVYPAPVKWCNAPAKTAVAGSVLVSVRAPVGDVNLAQEACCIGRGLAAVDGGDDLDNEFLFFYLVFSKSRLESRGTGSTFQSINKKVLQEFPLTLPPLPEQRAIAHVLSTVQQAIEATEKVIAATRELKRSLMRHLFTYGPVPLQEAERVPLKETEIGHIPGHWRIAPLGKLARIGNGSTPHRSDPRYWDGGTLPWLTSGKIHDGIIRQADEFVTPVAKSECHLPAVRSRSLLVAITGQGKTLGNVAMVTFDTCISQHLAYIEFQDDSVHPEYMLAFLQSRYSDFRQAAGAGGSTKGALTCAYLRQHAVPVPPIEEQRRIADVLRCVDRKIEAEEKRRVALEELFRSLLHHLMTGKVRVDPSIAAQEV